VLVVVEPSRDSLEVAERIASLSTQIKIGDVWIILNKITSEKLARELTHELNKRNLTVIGTIHHNLEIFQACLRGQPLSSGIAQEDINRVLDFLFP
jgi:CO dehydrogenase nickel-insertion accessory protein CooC1